MNANDSGRDENETTSVIDLSATLESIGLDRERLSLWLVTGLLLLGLLVFAVDFVGTLIVGLFVYYVCRPIFARIHTRIHNRTIAVAVTLVTIALPTLFLIAWTVAVLVTAVADFLGSTESEQLVETFEPYLGLGTEFGSGGEVVTQFLTDPRGFMQEVGPLLTDAATGIINVLAALGGVGIQAFIVLVIAFYLLRDDVRLAAWARRTFAPEGHILNQYLVRLDRDVENIFFGNILNALATGLIGVVSYALLNTIAPEVVTIPQPTLVGVVAGVASLVPAVGIKLVTWPLGVYLFARAALLEPQSIWFPAVFFVVSAVVVDYIPDQLLRPYVSGRGLHVGAVMLAYLFGPLLFGWYGIFLGPFLVAVLFDFARVVLPWLTRSEPAPHHTAGSSETNVADEPTPASATSDPERVPSDTDDENHSPAADDPTEEVDSEQSPDVDGDDGR